MNATNLKSGFYGTDSNTYFVSDAGRVWVIQTDDLRDTPFEIHPEGMESGFSDVSDLMSPDEMTEHLRRIEAEYGVTLQD